MRAIVAVAGQTALPVGREEAQRVPALPAPRVRDLTALEHDVIDRAIREKPARRETGVAGADHDGGDALDESALRKAGGVCSYATSTVTFTGFVITS